MNRATLSAAALVTALLPATAFAGLRGPQVSVNGTKLQEFFTSSPAHDAGVTNVNIMQDATYSWQKSGSGLATVTLQIENANPPGTDKNFNAIGIYNTVYGDRFELWDGNADADAFAIVQFQSGNNFIIHKYNANGSSNGDVPGSGIESNGFGFYLEKKDANPLADDKEKFCWTKDSMNRNFAPRALVFGGTGSHLGGWWVCFEDGRAQNAGEIDDFDDSIILIETVADSPVNKSTWAAVKARFR